jgi:hypothetical protein
MRTARIRSGGRVQLSQDRLPQRLHGQPLCLDHGQDRMRARLPGESPDGRASAWSAGST